MGKNGHWINNSSVACAASLEPADTRVYSDFGPMCSNCPYPRHGLFCHDAHGPGCLRRDMMEIEERSRAAIHRRHGKDGRRA